MKKVKLYWDLYYPIILWTLYHSFIQYHYGLVKKKLEGIFVGIWVPSILAMSVAIRQRRNDLFREQADKRRRFYNTKRKRK